MKYGSFTNNLLGLVTIVIFIAALIVLSEFR